MFSKATLVYNRYGPKAPKASLAIHSSSSGKRVFIHPAIHSAESASACSSTSWARTGSISVTYRALSTMSPPFGEDGEPAKKV